MPLFKSFLEGRKSEIEVDGGGAESKKNPDLIFAVTGLEVSTTVSTANTSSTEPKESLPDHGQNTAASVPVVASTSTINESTAATCRLATPSPPLKSEEPAVVLTHESGAQSQKTAEANNNNDTTDPDILVKSPAAVDSNDYHSSDSGLADLLFSCGDGDGNIHPQPSSYPIVMPALVVPVPPPPQQQPPPPPPGQNDFSFLDRSDYEDPITYQIMADPVTCQDGHTYDRPVIERCFDDRIKAERQRLEGEQEGGDDTGAVCCMANRGPIELLSPVTNKVVSGVLVPNFVLEQQIVRLMKANALGVDDQEMEDWEQRRKEKKVLDQQRQEKERRDRELAAQQRKNAEEAERRNRERGEAEKGPDPARVEPSQRVRFDPSAETGLAVPLAENGTQIPPEFITGSGMVLRCMVDRCAKRLDVEDEARYGHQWCARCARIVCNDCLSFSVTDFSTPGSGDSHRCCVDCITQLVDIMESSPDVHLRQRRVLLLRTLETHTARFANRLATIQDRVVRHTASNMHTPTLISAEQRISQLEQRLANLQCQAARAAARAAAAQSDEPALPSDSSDEPDGSTASLSEIEADIIRLTPECDAMERELDQLTENPPSEDDDEDAVVQYVESVSSLTERLNTARENLGVAMSKAEAASLAFTQRNRNKENEALEQEIQRLVECYEELARNAAEDGDIDKVLEMSRVGAELEEKQVQLATAHSVASAQKTSQRQDVERSRQMPFVLIPHTTGFVESARERLSVLSRKKKSILGRLRRASHDESTEAAQYWIDSVLRLKLEILGSSSSEMQAAKAGELLSLLLQTPQPQLFGDDWAQNVGLSAVQEELNHLVASGKKATVKKSHTKTTQKGDDIFLDIFSDPPEVNHLVDSGEKATAKKSHIRTAEKNDYIFLHRFSDLLSSPDQAKRMATTEPSKSKTAGFVDVDVGQLLLDLGAIGRCFDEWPLPHDLKYPTPRMVRQLEVLHNTLDLRKIESERVAEEEWEQWFQDLEAETERFEDCIAIAQREADTAQANAEDEERRQRERAEERRKKEEERQARERDLRQKAERVERERQEMVRRHNKEEEATKKAFADAINRDNAAEAFGERGDTRQCKRCRAGPVVNQACTDLKSHNDDSTSYKGHNVFSKKNPNHCINCGWFSPNWHDWPYWDGIYGPH